MTAPEENKKRIEELSTWDMNDTVEKYEGYDRISYPEPTAKNMMLFMNKINELTVEVNRLNKCLIIAQE